MSEYTTYLINILTERRSETPRKSERLLGRKVPESGTSLSSQMKAPPPLVLADTVGVRSCKSESGYAESSTISGIGVSWKGNKMDKGYIQEQARNEESGLPGATHNKADKSSVIAHMNSSASSSTRTIDKGWDSRREAQVLSVLHSSAAFMAWVHNGQLGEIVREMLRERKDELCKCLIAIKLAIDSCAVFQPRGKVNDKLVCL